MKIQLNKLSIYNFKGIKRFETLFDHVTNIYGDNATGKTSVFDAFLWLLFGKNSQGASQFDIKPIDPVTGVFVKDVETVVEAYMTFDGIETVLRKVLRQKWTTRRGSALEEYTGDECIYFWNDVNMKEGEFTAKITQAITESQLRMITDPFHFANMKWQERRSLLMKMAGTMTPDAIIASITEPGNFEPILAAFAQNKSLEEFKKQLAHQKGEAKKEKELIPSRIDELKRTIPEAIDFTAIRTEAISVAKQLEAVNAEILSGDAAMEQLKAANRELMTQYQNDLNAHSRSIVEAQNKVMSIERELRVQATGTLDNLFAEKTSLDSKITARENQIATLERKRDQYNKEIKDLEHQKDALSKRYDIVSAEVFSFDESTCLCPTCKRQLDTTNIEQARAEAEANFNTTKANNLTAINAKGKETVQDINRKKEELSNTVAELSDCNNHLADLLKAKQELADKISSIPSTEETYAQLCAQSTEYVDATAKLEELKAYNVPQPETKPISANTELQAKAQELSDRHTQLQIELSNESRIKEAEERLAELMKQEAALGEQIANIEGIEYSILLYMKAEMAFVDAKINGMFKEVRFRMFKTQVNGGEAETCDIMVNTNGSWVPFSSGNRAGQINAGVDIINSISRHFDVQAPIFIDNRESVTALIPSDAQLINLFVSPTHKKLTVGSSVAQMAEA